MMTHGYLMSIQFFFFNDTATTEIYTLSLHDALPISSKFSPVSTPFAIARLGNGVRERVMLPVGVARTYVDRKSTRLNSSHANISYAVFCLKKKKNNIIHSTYPRLYTLHSTNLFA